MNKFLNLGISDPLTLGMGHPVVNRIKRLNRQKTTFKGGCAAFGFSAAALMLTLPVTAKEAATTELIDNYPARVVVSQDVMSEAQGAEFFKPSDDPFPDVLTMQSKGGEAIYFKFSQLAPLGKKSAATDIVLGALKSCQNKLQTKDTHRFTISLETASVSLPAGDYHILCLQGEAS